MIVENIKLFQVFYHFPLVMNIKKLNELINELLNLLSKEKICFFY